MLTTDAPLIARVMASPSGRLLRVLAGIGLIYWGVSLPSPTGTFLLVAGAVAIAAGVFNFCLIAPLIGAPFWGSKLR
jgi:hypothetical protein